MHMTDMASELRRFERTSEFPSCPVTQPILTG
jgi:hypothetical protein